jgi:catechol 2,3-dioxygenase-like lactoylglutathione lyase family enzyme
MGILETAQPAVVICTRDRARATAFYRDVLGLPLISDDQFAAVFRSGGTTLRVSTVPDFEPHGHTMLGFRVSDVRETVRALKAAGASFDRHLEAQDEELILTMGQVQVAWMKDPDGNILSVTSV